MERKRSSTVRFTYHDLARAGSGRSAQAQRSAGAKAPHVQARKIQRKSHALNRTAQRNLQTGTRARRTTDMSELRGLERRMAGLV